MINQDCTLLLEGEVYVHSRNGKNVDGRLKIKSKEQGDVVEFKEKL